MRGDNLKAGERKHRGKFTENLLNNDLIIKSLGIAPGQTVLDAGCGNGYMTKLFAKAVGPAGKVYALDTDSQAISILRHQTRGTNIETIMGDISQETVIEASSLDMIYIATVLHSFTRQQLQEFIREVKRLLKPDGVLAVVEIVKQETPFGPPLSMRYSPEELKALVPLKAENTVAVAEHFYMQVFRHHPKFTNKSDR